VTTAYAFPRLTEPPQAAANSAYLVASGDLRRSANVKGWPVQQKLEADLARALGSLGWSVVRAHDYDEQAGHGFIDSQRRGIEVFFGIPAGAPVIVAEAVWQYSHHVLSGLRTHRGPILVVANWDGVFPGLVGLLNLTASLTKAGVPYSSLWSHDFTDAWALGGLRRWLADGRLIHPVDHVHELPALDAAVSEVALGRALARELCERKAIIGVFDEGCMGMYNAVIDDELLNPIGIFKERLSQSALVAEMSRVADDEARAARAWLDRAGLRFGFGADPDHDLTPEQVHAQLTMYVAALRIADDFGLDAVGIQYQQGLKDLVPASDLAEGLLNNVARPPVRSRDGSRELYPGRPLPHFNEVDEGAAVDALITSRLWTAMGLDPATTLHDVRWGEQFEGEFVWTFMISGAVPASHNGGYQRSYSLRQPKMYFPLGGGTLSGCSRPGQIVWSRVFIEGGRLHADLGRGHVAELPEAETQRRLALTTPEWPIMHAVLHGVGRDQLMAKHKANHVQVAYAPDAKTANQAATAKAAFLDALGMRVHVCGDAGFLPPRASGQHEPGQG
jgi:L-fucose isomerase-like protein